MAFNAYAGYYNLLYKNKDYKTEAEYVNSLIKIHNSSAKTILDLGCGTGRHAAEFVKLGYDVVGVDLSLEMIDIANGSKIPHTEFHQGNITTVRLNKQFDIVISLFHVMSYQTTNEALKAAFETAKIHLKEGGIFMFDFWYGVGVLTDQPSVRIKRMEDDNISVLRIAEPIIHYSENIVDVNFEVRVRDKISHKEEFFMEKHIIRYLFLPEVKFLSSLSNFSEIKIQDNLFTTTWYSLYVCKKMK